MKSGTFALGAMMLIAGFIILYIGLTTGVRFYIVEGYFVRDEQSHQNVQNMIGIGGVVTLIGLIGIIYGAVAQKPRQPQ